MSQGVIDWFLNLSMRRILAALVALCALAPPVWLGAAENPPFLVSHMQVRKPSQLIPAIESTLPAEFSKYPFSIYHVFSAKNNGTLEPVVCVPADSAAVWQSLAKKQEWLEIEQESFRMYFQAGSSLGDSAAFHSRILDHLRVAPSSVASGGLLSDWKAFLGYIQNSTDLRTHFLNAAFPFMENFSETLGAYSHWLLNELSNIESLEWEVDPSQGTSAFVISASTSRGSRLHRLFGAPSGDPTKLFGFVSDDHSNLNLGWLHSANATNYFNHFYRGTLDVENTSFRAIRGKLDVLDAGIFDRWDGSWALWNPNNGEDRLLLLGGRFQPSDLTELYEVLAEVPWGEISGSLELDEDNSVVGFTRIRSFEWNDEGEPSLVSLLVPRKVYFGIANGFVAISESDSALTELIFALNSRKPLRNSALSFFEDEKGYSMRDYRNEKLVGAVTLDEGRMVLRQNSPPDWFYSFLRKATKNFAQ